MSDETREELLERGELELEGKTHEQIVDIVTLETKKAMVTALEGGDMDLATRLSKLLGFPVKIGTTETTNTVHVQVEMPAELITVNFKI